MYRAIFSRRAVKSFLDLPTNDAQSVKEAIEDPERDPRGQHTIKLDRAPVAQYRRRVGNFRVLFDLDDQREILQILDIRKRDERTYK